MMRKLILMLVLVSNLSYERSFIIKEREEVLKYEIYDVVSYYFPIERVDNKGILYLKILPIVVKDVVLDLKVYFYTYGYNTYKVVFLFEFYKITSNGLVKTNNVDKVVWNLVSAFLGEFSRSVRNKIVYEW